VDLHVQYWFEYSLLMAIVGLAAIIDSKTHRIPNWLSFSGWYLGPVCHLMLTGLPGLYSSLLGLLIVLVITFPLFAIRWMGAGDVKLLVSVGALVGNEQALIYLAVIFITGAVIGIIQLMIHGLLRTWFKRYWLMMGMSISEGRPVYLSPEHSEASTTMPYAVSIAVGSLVAVCLL
jgi:prepilin peptidase CpaA